jgi:hypothetical protein
MEVIDDPLMKIARKRVGFKKNFASYVIVNGFLWAIWYFTDRGYPWPIWPMLGWGVGIAFNYVDAYELDKSDMVNKEYEKLKKERGQS